MIDIIIPVYNDYTNLRTALSSIAMQTIKENVIVYIIDDGSKYVYKNVIDEFKDEFKIVFFPLAENVGGGMSRQIALEKSKSEYILFLDSDDVLYSPLSLQTMLRCITKGYDYVHSWSFNELFDAIYDSTADLHGKMYRRKFIEKKHIKFNSTRIHEDLFFNECVLVCRPKSKYLDELTYVYKNNLESVTHIEKEEKFAGYEISLKNIKSVIDFAKLNNCSDFVLKRNLKPRVKFYYKTYNRLDEEHRKILKSWIYKYNLEKEFARILRIEG